jgi:predicted PurR-regulated permease PerM
MLHSPSSGNIGHIFVSAACFVIVVAGMRVASPILVPFLLSVFIAVVLSPALFWMRSVKIPLWLSLLIITFGLCLFGLLLSLLLGTSLNDFLQNLPAYQDKLKERTSSLLNLSASLGLDISQSVIAEYINPGMAIQMAANVFTRLSNVLTNVFFILLTAVFILIELTGLTSKVTMAMERPQKTLTFLDSFTNTVNRYLTIKTLVSLGTGLCIFVFLHVLGVDFPLLWGVLAFFLNYVPNIGSIIAALPPVLLAYIQLGGVSALITAFGFLVVNVVIGNLIEPRFMGQRLGLSTLVVFLSLVFWGWVLGPVGMLLSVPLTMIVKIALENNEDTRWMAILLGSGQES